MKQGMTESVGDYLTRIIKPAMIKDVSENLLLSVAMNGLKSDKIISCYTQPQYNGEIETGRTVNRGITTFSD